MRRCGLPHNGGGREGGKAADRDICLHWAVHSHKEMGTHTRRGAGEGEHVLGALPPVD